MFEISLAEWSLRHPLKNGQMTNLDFPKVAKETFGITGLEYVNQYFFDKATDRVYLAELNDRSQEAGTQPLLIMCDREGSLASADKAKRAKAVNNHKKWITAAWALGCHSIRVNAHGEGDRASMTGQMSESLRALCEFADPYDVNVIIENHGGLSSDASWVVEVIKACDHELAGTLPDFGNFVINRKTGEAYDTYKGIDELMPYAQGVSAKCKAFGPDGQETRVDYERLMKIVYGHGFHGFVGIEWGGKDTEYEAGIKACKKLLLKLRDQLA